MFLFLYFSPLETSLPKKPLAFPYDLSLCFLARCTVALGHSSLGYLGNILVSLTLLIEHVSRAFLRTNSWEVDLKTWTFPIFAQLTFFFSPGRNSSWKSFSSEFYRYCFTASEALHSWHPVLLLRGLMPCQLTSSLPRTCMCVLSNFEDLLFILPDGLKFHDLPCRWS